MPKALIAILGATLLVLAAREYMPSDAVIFASWAERLARAPWGGFANGAFLPQAAPGWLVWLGLLGNLGVLPPAAELGPVGLLVLKAPAVAALMGLAILVYREAGRWNGRATGEFLERSPWVFALAMSPALIYDATVRGHYVSLEVLLGVLVVRGALFGPSLLGAVAFGALLALQPLGILMLPLLVARRVTPAPWLVCGVALPLAAAAPFVGGNWVRAGELILQIVSSPPGARGELNLPAALGGGFVPLTRTVLGQEGAWLLGAGAVLFTFLWYLRQRARAPEKARSELDLCGAAAFVLAFTSAMPGMPTCAAAVALPFFYFLALRTPGLFLGMALLTVALTLDQVYWHHTETFADVWRQHFHTDVRTWRTPLVTFSALTKLGLWLTLLGRCDGLAAGRRAPPWRPWSMPSLAFRWSEMGDATRRALASVGARAIALASHLPAPHALAARDLLALGAIAAVAAAMSFYRLGVRDMPRTSVDGTTTMTLELASERPVIGLWLFKDRHAAELELRCGNADWHKTAFDRHDSWEWAFRRLERPCQNALEVRVGSAEGRIFELLFADDRGGVVREGRVCAGDHEPCRALAQHPLFDESARFESPPSRLDGAVFDEHFNIETGMKSVFEPTANVLTTAHPFLGRALIAASMRAFGPSPWSWRLPGAICGALIPLLFFFLGRELFGERRIAYLAALLALLDCSRLALARVATVDSQLLVWLLLGYGLLFRYLRLVLVDSAVDSGRTRRQRWVLVSAVLCFGAATATKWIGAFAGPVVLLVVAVSLGAKIHRGEAPRWRRFFLWSSLAALVPAAIYVAAYLPFLASGGLGEKLRGIAGHQANILKIHTQIDALNFNPYQSPASLWALVERPMAIYYRYGAAPGRFEASFIVANPVIWWAIMPAFLLLLVNRAARRNPGASYLAVAFVAQWLPWMFVARHSYLYHYASASLFGLTAIAAVLGSDGAVARRMRWPFVALAAAVFILFWPFVVGSEVSASRVAAVQWFDGWFAIYDTGVQFTAR